MNKRRDTTKRLKELLEILEVKNTRNENPVEGISRRLDQAEERIHELRQII